VTEKPENAGVFVAEAAQNTEEEGTRRHERQSSLSAT
jgi:hypothetical protein